MGGKSRPLSFRDILGLLKDKASLSRAALLHPSAVLLLRATTHSPPAPPPDRHLSALLLFGHSARATASPLISALIDRLHRTRNSVVAIKCLLIIHHIIHRGPFILQDQLSVFPPSGGRNYLKLSTFRDGTAWELSGWVRWYARYLETSLSTRRLLGYFVSSSNKENQQIKISSSLNSDLIREIDALAVLIEEISKLPDPAVPDGNLLVKEIIGLVITDYLSSVIEILARVGEVSERLSCLSFGDSLELVCALNRLANSRERLSAIYLVEKPSIETMWSSIAEMKERIERTKMYRDGGKLLILGRSGKTSESARFDGRVVDSVKFHSGRF